MALSIDVSTADPNLLNVRDAMLVSTSKDGGRTWGTITPLIADDSPLRLNDKNSLTADPTRRGHAYAVWDRLELTQDLQAFRGPTLFTRTTNGGKTWERPRVIFDPGLNNQTIANQIAVLPNGRLVNVFDWIIQGQLNVGVMFSDDKGETWTEPKLVNALGTVGVTDPFDGAPVRTGDLVPDIAVDWLTVSTDKGSHFAARERQTARSFDMRLAPLTGAGYFVGDYEGLDGVGRRFHPVFGVTRNTANPVDIVSTIARPPFGPSTAALQTDATAAARTAPARQQPLGLGHPPVADGTRGRPASTRQAGLRSFHMVMRRR